MVRRPLLKTEEFESEKKGDFIVQIQNERKEVVDLIGVSRELYYSRCETPFFSGSKLGREKMRALLCRLLDVEQLNYFHIDHLFDDLNSIIVQKSTNKERVILAYEIRDLIRSLFDIRIILHDLNNKLFVAQMDLERCSDQMKTVGSLCRLGRQAQGEVEKDKIFSEISQDTVFEENKGLFGQVGQGVLSMFQAIEREDQIFLNYVTGRTENPVEIVRNLVCSYALSDPDKQFSFTFKSYKEGDLQKNSEILNIHSQYLERVMANLIKNACESISSKGKIEITFEKTNNNFFIKIKDSGTGIPENYQPLVFRKGFTTKSPHANRGVGMSSIQNYIELSGGKIFLNSQTGKESFTEVVLQLPLMNVGSLSLA